MLMIGVDTGGTFTDFIWRDGDRSGTFKRLSTPHDPAEAVLDGLRQLAGEHSFVLIHGSTVATNAILERKGAPTALVTNRGFEDVLQIGRQNRPELYRLDSHPSPPLVPADRRLGIAGRIGADGTLLQPLDAAELAALADRVRATGAASVAVCLLFGFAAPAEERRVGEALAALGLPVSLAHEVLAEFREYERLSTTVINAYVRPKMETYVDELQTAVGDRSFRIMQSNGGSISAVTAMRQSVRTILSGPAGGAVGALALGRRAGFDRLITFDMGGTSTDVALLDRQLPLTTESSIDGLPVKVPMIAIHTVGAGGGSLAGIDAGGALTVGPDSAGADPGPVCYGRGDGITVTDAHLQLGRLIPQAFLGGGMALQPERLKRPFAALARQLGLKVPELAEGILSVANATMARAIKVISVERGYDPRDFTLFSFGGAGGLHAADLARDLSIPRVLIPRHAGILSALGMLLAEVVKDYSLTVMLGEEALATADFAALFAPLEAQAQREMTAEGVEADSLRLEPALDMRYRGQSFELMVPFGPDYRARFHDLHARSYGYASPDKPLEVVNLRLRAVAPGEALPQVAPPPGGVRPDASARRGTVTARFAGQARKTAWYDREALRPGNRITGPAILAEYSSTTVVPPWADVEVDAATNLILTVRG